MKLDPKYIKVGKHGTHDPGSFGEDKEGLLPTEEDWEYVEDLIDRVTGEVDTLDIPSPEAIVNGTTSETREAVLNSIGKDMPALSADISEALVHSVPDDFYLAFSSEELSCLYEWAKSLKSGEEFFNQSAVYEKYAYLMFDGKANVIHEHFLYKKTLMDRASFISELERLYREEAESIPEKLKILSLIQIERTNMDKAQAEFRKHMKAGTAETESNLEMLLKRVVKRQSYT